MRPGYPATNRWAKPVFLLVFLAVLGGAYFGYTRYRAAVPADSAIPSEALLRLEPTLRTIALRLNTDPCNRTLSFEVTSGLLQNADYASVIRLGQSLRSKCGPNQDLLASIYTAQVLINDYVNAETTADDMVTAFPAAPTAYGWRSMAREKNGNLSGAYADMRVELSLFPDPKTIPLRSFYELAHLADGAGNPCEAIAVLRDYVAYDALNRQTQQISAMTSDWQKKGACPPQTGAGTALLHYDPRSGAIILPVEINGIVAKMAIDTGATRTVLTEDLASRAGIAHNDQVGAMITTANGQIWAASGRAKTVALGGARLNNVPVFVQKMGFGGGIEGLLGLSFLGNFQVRISGGTLELQPVK
jgi:clan AA aspartic protease (TIGR02281 family)